MFVTVWVGILELSTGKLVSANAGHEFPVLRRPDGLFEMIQDTHGFIIGGMPGQKYKEYTTVLEPGCKLFLYTDGVPEAINPETEQFGTDRMLAALNRDPDASPEQLLKNVQADIDEFVRGADQFDDLTMLCVHYLQKTGSEESVIATSADSQETEAPAI
jgi:sigma-B regulation protein RsbU (phosphoserine phosphatase)